MLRNLQSVLVLASLALVGTFAFASLATAEEETAIPVEPLHLLSEEEGVVGSPVVALRPEGGMVAVWTDLSALEIVGRWFLPADHAAAPASGRFVLGEATGASPRLAMARGVGDRYVAVWQEGWPGQALWTRAFDGSGTPLGPVRNVASPAVLSPAIAARPGGGFVVAYWERVDDGFTVRYLLLSDGGSPLGAVDVDTLPEGWSPTDVNVTVDPDGAFTIAWSWRNAITSELVLAARTFSSAGAPAGPPFELTRLDNGFFHVEHAIAAVGAGELLAVWVEGRSSGSWILWARHFHPDGSLAPARRVDDANAPEPHGITNPALAATPDGRAVVAWIESETSETHILGRLLEADASARGLPFEVATLPEGFIFFADVDADRDESGRIAFGWSVGSESGVLPPGGDVDFIAYARRFQEVETAGPPVPDAPPLVSDELPGFRTWVVITAGGEAVLGTGESACIPETLCVSGRVPGRSEVFVRVVGPKPNGRLWPTLVKFTTSTVDVWIEQVSTGEIEHYRLEGASPGVDELPGLFDREGFVP